MRPIFLNNTDDVKILLDLIGKNLKIYLKRAVVQDAYLCRLPKRGIT